MQLRFSRNSLQNNHYGACFEVPEPYGLNFQKNKGRLGHTKLELPNTWMDGNKITFCKRQDDILFAPQKQQQQQKTTAVSNSAYRNLLNYFPGNSLQFFLGNSAISFKGNCLTSIKMYLERKIVSKGKKCQ